MKISVVIPTHNPRQDYISRVLGALATQTLPPDYWELIVVDNGSKVPVSAEIFGQLPLRGRVIREEKLGLAYARMAGIEAAQGDLIAFVDDDNILDDHYLESAVEIFSVHPEVGAVGGMVVPEFEITPPDWVKAHPTLLALRDLGGEFIVSDWKNKSGDYPWCAPFGAGMVLRRHCAARYLQQTGEGASLDVGRQGTAQLGACEDADLILRGVLRTGFEVAYSPKLTVTHLIPKRRLDFSYLSRLAFESGVVWGKFCVRHGFLTPLPAWTVPLRLVRWFYNCKAWSRDGWLRWRSLGGLLIGRTGSGK